MGGDTARAGDEGGQGPEGQGQQGQDGSEEPPGAGEGGGEPGPSGANGEGAGGGAARGQRDEGEGSSRGGREEGRPQGETEGSGTPRGGQGEQGREGDDRERGRGVRARETEEGGRRTRRRIEGGEGGEIRQLEPPAGSTADDTQARETSVGREAAVEAGVTGEERTRQGEGRGWGEALVGAVRGLTARIGSVWGAMTGKRSRGQEASAAGDEKRRRTGDG